MKEIIWKKIFHTKPLTKPKTKGTTKTAIYVYFKSKN
jgi:hypothetical protein